MGAYRTDSESTHNKGGSMKSVNLENSAGKKLSKIDSITSIPGKVSEKKVAPKIKYLPGKGPRDWDD